MATKGKGKILDGQIAFEFMGIMETEVKPRRTKAIEQKIINKKQTKTKKIFRKKYVNVKPNHLKRHRKVRKISRKFERNNYGKLN